MNTNAISFDDLVAAVKQLSIKERLALMQSLGDSGRDFDDQIIIYTGLKEDISGEVVEM